MAQSCVLLRTDHRVDRAVRGSARALAGNAPPPSTGWAG